MIKAIEIKNLEKKYKGGPQALNGIDLCVDDGDFFALLGANGAGKTTIIGILTGLVNKSSGSVKVFGVDIEDNFSKVKSMIGLVPQEINFNMFEKVQDIIVNEAGYFGIKRQEALMQSEQILKDLELWDKKDAVSRFLSGGMKRRLMIARALITRPKLLILDEPTAGVDVELRQGMWKILLDLNKKGTTMLLTTHYLEEVEILCQKAAIIKEGVIIKNDTVQNLMKMVEEQSYIVHVDQVSSLEKFTPFRAKLIDQHTFEIEIMRKSMMNDFIASMLKSNMSLMDLRPKGNRLEHLFLGILKNK